MYVYNFQLSTGLILGVETAAQMNTQQIFRLGEIAKTEKKYTLAVPWFELTLQKLLEDEYGNTNMINFVRGLLQATMMEVTGFGQN